MPTIRSLAPDDERNLRETLKRCSSETVEAACRFRRTGALETVPTIVQGVIERYVEREHRPKLKEPNDRLRLVEDLAIDSLSLLEIVLVTEDVLRISINNDELCQLRTLGDVKRFMEEKIRPAPTPLAQA